MRRSITSACSSVRSISCPRLPSWGLSPVDVALSRVGFRSLTSSGCKRTSDACQSTSVGWLLTSVRCSLRSSGCELMSDVRSAMSDRRQLASVGCSLTSSGLHTDVGCARGTVARLHAHLDVLLALVECLPRVAEMQEQTSLGCPLTLVCGSLTPRACKLIVRFVTSHVARLPSHVGLRLAHGDVLQTAFGRTESDVAHVRTHVASSRCDVERVRHRVALSTCHVDAAKCVGRCVGRHVKSVNREINQRRGNESSPAGLASSSSRSATNVDEGFRAAHMWRDRPSYMTPDNGPAGNRQIFVHGLR